jgi:3-phenylpropionate/trans-cinnamate dioxygenase ferredoxin reductase component
MLRQRCDFGQRIRRHHGASGGGVSFRCFAGDRFLAVDAMKDPRTYMVGKRLLEAGYTPPRSRSVERPETDLKALLVV